MNRRQKQYQKLLRDPKWKKKRDKIVSLDKRCLQCGRRADLHVHHLYYLPGKNPWQYPISALATLCKGCHAREHIGGCFRKECAKKVRQFPYYRPRS